MSGAATMLAALPGMLASGVHAIPGMLSSAGSSAMSGLSSVGSELGKLGGLFSNPAGLGSFVTPGSAGTPSITDIGAAISANPGTAGITSGMITGVGPQSGPSGPTQASANPTMTGNILSGLGPVGGAYMDYIQKMKLLKQSQKTDYAAPHSSASGQTSPLALQPPTPFAIPGSI